MSNAAPAFSIVLPRDFREAFSGLTKREYAAIHILAGIMARPDRDRYQQDPVALAISSTDELFERLNKETK